MGSIAISFRAPHHVESIIGSKGNLQGATKKDARVGKDQSQLCRRQLYTKFLALVVQWPHKDALPEELSSFAQQVISSTSSHSDGDGHSTTPTSVQSPTYKAVKQAAHRYQAARLAFLSHTNFSNWIQKDPKFQEFSLDWINFY